MRAGVQEQTGQTEEGSLLKHASGSGGKCLFYVCAGKGHELALVKPVLEK